MKLLSKAGGALLVAVAALLGNWVGDSVRASAIGEAAPSMAQITTTSGGRKQFGLSITLTNFVPALLLALLAGKPRTVYAFVSGAIISALVGDTYEKTLGKPSYEQVHV
jgi:hypothetical protein